MSQKDDFLGGEGNAYFQRNAGRATPLHGKIAPALQALDIHPRTLLEIGCDAGTGLEGLRHVFGAKCYGITPGEEPVQRGAALHPELTIIEGTADKLPFPDGMFDVVIFGFCLYLCDPELYPRIVSESDRVLAGGGTLVIADFMAKTPYSVPFGHRPGARSYHREFAQLWSPTYRLISRTLGEGTPDDCEAVDVLRKDHGTPTAVM